MGEGGIGVRRGTYLLFFLLHAVLAELWVRSPVRSTFFLKIRKKKRNKPFSCDPSILF